MRRERYRKQFRRDVATLVLDDAADPSPRVAGETRDCVGLTPKGTPRTVLLVPVKGSTRK